VTAKDDRWRIWDENASYGQVLYDRATGKAPEMESSKAAAKRLQGVLGQGDKVLDVGCGAGHYLRTLRRVFTFPFSYTGVDATQNYVDLAAKAFTDDAHAKFLRGDIEKIPVDDRSFDTVLCMNVLLHLPRIAPAVRELWRATKRTMLIRTMVGEKSFRIKQVREWEGDVAGHNDPLFDAEGEPLNFHYFNIYSKKYVEWLCSTLPGAKPCTIEADSDFDPAALSVAAWPDTFKPGDITQAMGGLQVNGSIIEPWAFIRVDRESD
jgi:ubiquinone/menaquinone biosynthesis C-methylase UbiE